MCLFFSETVLSLFLSLLFLYFRMEFKFRHGENRSTSTLLPQQRTLALPTVPLVSGHPLRGKVHLYDSGFLHHTHLVSSLKDNIFCRMGLSYSSFCIRWFSGYYPDDKNVPNFGTDQPGGSNPARDGKGADKARDGEG